MKKVHRNRLFDAAVVLLILAVVAPWAAGALEVSRDVNTYSLFGLQTVSVKGRNGFTDRGFISGNVGANPAETNTNTWLLNIGAGGVVIMADGTQMVGDSVRADQASVYDLFVNRLNSNSPDILRGTQSIFTAPIINGTADWTTFTITGDLPAFPFTPDRLSTNSASPVNVGMNGSATLLPGVYGDLQVNDNAVLNLSAGLYDFRNFNIGKGVVVNVSDDTILQIDRGFFLGEGTTFGVGTSAGAQIYVGAWGLTGANDLAASLARGGRNAQNTIYGQLYCPFGDFNMGNHSNLYGRFWARNIADDWNTNVTYMIPEPATMAILGLGSVLFLRKRR